VFILQSLCRWEEIMGIRDWFKALARGQDIPRPDVQARQAADIAAPAASTAAEEEYAGLNFKTAIDAHMKWKSRLEQYINGTSEENLSVEGISRDDQCVLGKWIHSTGGQRFGNLREFQELKMDHARFHLCAGDVLTCAVAGDKQGAFDKLRSGDYSQASERVKLHLARLYVQLTSAR
jgi:Chemoreceptor zinc-binding domain